MLLMHKWRFPEDCSYILLTTRPLDAFKVDNVIVQFRNMGREKTRAEDEADELMGASTAQH
jgi:hypothetical protein